MLHTPDLGRPAVPGRTISAIGLFGALATLNLLGGGCPPVLQTSTTLESITPASGPTTGGTTVTLRGRALGAETGVLFGGRSATRINRVNDQLIEADTPGGEPGLVDVTILSSDGSQSVLADAFEYLAAETGKPDDPAGEGTDGDGDGEQDAPPGDEPAALHVETITPARGPEIGGTVVTILGEGFSEGMVVLFGGFLAESIEPINSQALSAVAPAQAPGAVDVVVRHPDGRVVTTTDGFEYVAMADADDEIVDQLEEQFPGGPRLVSAVSTSNTSVQVTFSEPVSATAAHAANYSIVQESVNPEAGALLVESAAQSSDQMEVTLTTYSQNELTYELSVTGIRDLAGNPLAPPELLVDPTRTSFAGTPPAGAGVDTDGDGVPDHEEQRGYTVSITQSDGSVIERGVTSDPRRADTDGDGLNDADEKSRVMDPRATDTDADQVDDHTEVRVWRSSGIRQDTDGDGLADSSELFFATAPTLADTDGDQLDDADEIINRGRNPRVADLPRVGIEVGDVELELDERFTYVDQFQETRTESEQVSTTISRDRSTSATNSHTDSTIASWNASVTAGFKLNLENADLLNLGVPKVNTEQSVSATTSGGMTFEDTWVTTESSSTSSSETYNDTVSRVAEFSSVGVTTRETIGARVLGTVTIRTDSDIAFSVSDLEISALQIDPEDPQRFIPIATLLPGSPDTVYNLGPLDPDRGPFVFENADVFPSLVEQLMKNPRGLVFKVANFNITDEFGRNFAFSSQDVVERTAELTLDFGNGQRRNQRIATAGPFDEFGRHTGVTMEQALGAIGLLAYRDENGDLLDDPELGDPDDPGDTRPKPTDPRIQESFGTRPVAVSDEPNAATVRRITRVRGVQNDFDLPSAEPGKANDGGFWAFFYTPADGNDRQPIGTTDFEQIRLRAGERYTFAFVQDRDLDGLFSLEESFSHSSDTDTDSDSSVDPNGTLRGDGLVDYFEVRGAWDEDGLGLWSVTTDRLAGDYRAFSSPAIADSDDDGLDDGREYGLCVLDRSGGLHVTGTFDPNADPDEPGAVTWDMDPNTLADPFPCVDEDGTAVSDNWYVESNLDPNTFRPALPANRASLDPRKADTDEDGVSDRDEVAGYAFTLFDDDPADGLAHRIFTFSDPRDADTDDDGLIDGMERLFGTNPVVDDSGRVFDDDLDGLPNRVEETGWEIEVHRADGSVDALFVSSRPDRADTDRDGLPDYVEFVLGTNPDDPDTDADGLTDWEEWDGSVTSDQGDELAFCDVAPNCSGYNLSNLPYATDPTDADTDDDGLAEGAEVAGWNVQLFNQVPYETSSDPLAPDTDLDGLSDGEEYYGADGLAPGEPGDAQDATDPQRGDTDDDGTIDGTELAQTATIDRPDVGTQRSPLVPDQRVTVTFLGVSIIESVAEEFQGVDQYLRMHLTCGIDIPLDGDQSRRLWVGTGSSATCDPAGNDAFVGAGCPLDNLGFPLVDCSNNDDIGQCVRGIRYRDGFRPTWPASCQSQSFILRHGEVFMTSGDVEFGGNCNCDYYASALPAQAFVGPVDGQLFSIDVRDMLGSGQTCPPPDGSIEFSIEALISVD